MKKFLLFAALVVAAIMPSAAQFRFGAEAGLNLSHEIGHNPLKPGFSIGATGEYNFTNHWALQTSLSLSSQPTKSEINWGTIDTGEMHKETVEYTPYYLSIPLRATYSFNASQDIRLSVGFGPQIGVGLFGKTSIIDNGKEDAKASYTDIFNSNSPGCYSNNRFQYGFNARIGA
ncbi:MAG: PorT family protein [Muribaculaceae bacterium]|nr:PorT family protein [Muribaculaceae bacterium]